MQTDRWTANVNWNSDAGGWNVNAHSVTNPNEWNAGNQVISRHSLLFLATWRGFCEQAFAPAANHATNCFDILTDDGELLGGNQLALPTDLQEKTEGVERDQGVSEASKLCLAGAKRGSVNGSKEFQKEAIDFLPETKALTFWEVAVDRQPLCVDGF